jgi:acyl-CoA synthetase (NDP forming)
MSHSRAGAKPAAHDELEALFRPQSIAVVGASANPQSQGYEFVQALVEIGFPGPIHPVNPKLEELFGRKAYPRLEAVPGAVDFVISAVPASATLELVDAARAKQAKLIHLFTARFSETGREEATRLERELRTRVKEAGIRVIGPNCMGLYYPKAKLTFDPGLPAEPGDIGFLTQSGSHAFRVIGRGKERGLRFSKVISYGNALDLDESDFLDHFAEDPETSIIAAYVEGIRDGRRFFSALRRAAARKPVIVLKGGRSPAGHTAASSHTAALAGQMKLWRGAVRQAGAIEVRTINELVDMLVTFRYAGHAEGNRVAVLGGAGGETVESADLCSEAGFELPLPPAEMRAQLRETMPHAWDWVGNPVDASILAWGRRSESFAVMEMMAASPAYDAIIANVRGIEQALGRDDGGELFRDTLDRAKRLAKGSGKAAMFVLGEPESSEEWRWKGAIRVREELAAAGIAVFPDMDRATHAMSRYLGHLARRRNGNSNRSR